jgi:hypothetical protein
MLPPSRDPTRSRLHMGAHAPIRIRKQTKLVKRLSSADLWTRAFHCKLDSSFHCSDRTSAPPVKGRAPAHLSIASLPSLESPHVFRYSLVCFQMQISNLVPSARGRKTIRICCTAQRPLPAQIHLYYQRTLGLDSRRPNFPSIV